MKRIVFSSVILSAIVAAGSASAADLTPYSPPIVVPFSWTGFYVGVEGGGGLQFESTTGTTGVGGEVGGEIGYNYQFNGFVVGIEGEGFWADVKSSENTSASIPGTPFISSTSSETNNSFFDVGVRFGFTPSERSLLYGKLGAAWSNLSISMTTTTPSFTTGSETTSGVLIGGGFEYAMTNNWIARFETDARLFSGPDVALTTTGAFPATTTETIHPINVVMRIGVSYKF